MVSLRYRLSVLAASLALSTAVTGGCNEQPSGEELGELEFKLPKVAGADAPYVLPELDSPSAETGKKADSDAN
jgi:hypothetical protein